MDDVNVTIGEGNMLGKGLYTARNFKKDPPNADESILVNSLNIRWNSLVPSMERMYEQLVDLGFRDEDGKVYIVENESEKDNV